MGAEPAGSKGRGGVAEHFRFLFVPWCVGPVYRFLSTAVIGGLLPALMLHPKLRRGIRHRLGLYPRGGPLPPSRGAGPRIWLHGASAGDLLALLPIMLDIRRQRPDSTLIVSTMTNSGYTIAQDRLARHVDLITWVPYDFSGATRRAVAALRPDLLVLEYTEIWPNLISAAHSMGAAIALTNGRFNEALLWRYKLFFRLIGNPLELIDLLLMREDVEAERAIQLGARRDRVRVTGNTKFDNLSKGPSEETVHAMREAFALGSEPVFVAGSTHDGEERKIIRAFRGMREVAPDLRMIIAPRYAERGGRVAALARAEGFAVAMKSELRGPVEGRPPVLVLDTMGELNAAYRLATLVFVGGSFVRRGGQNILEPAGQGRPVLFGPHMMNFRDSVEVLAGRGGIQVGTAGQLERVGRELLGRPDEIERLGWMALEAVRKFSGASRRNAEELLTLVDRHLTSGASDGARRE